MTQNSLKHIAFIMDGNTTWAKRQGIDAFDGYLAGMRNLAYLVCDINKLGIPFVTCYAFSSENWGRPQSWIRRFWDLSMNFLETDPLIQMVLDAKVKLRIIGDRQKLPQKLQDIVLKYEDMTKDNNGTVMQLALSYGGRDEIVRAVRKLVSLQENIDEETISRYLDTGGIPDPDLIVRTSAKQRLSNFLLWQASYSEFYFSELCWPEFGRGALIKAIEDYQERVRTFGKLR